MYLLVYVDKPIESAVKYFGEYTITINKLTDEDRVLLQSYHKNVIEVNSHGDLTESYFRDEFLFKLLSMYLSGFKFYSMQLAYKVEIAYKATYILIVKVSE